MLQKIALLPFLLTALCPTIAPAPISRIAPTTRTAPAPVVPAKTAPTKSFSISSTQAPTFTADEFKAAVDWDYGGENGLLQGSAGPSLGYPCGVPSSYSWKYGTSSVSDIAAAIANRGPQTAAAAYNQIYNVCGTRKSVPNARIEFTGFVVQVYSNGQWTQVKYPSDNVGGAGFAEDFLNNQATQADIRDEANGHKSVRSGVGNAALPAGGTTGRTGVDGAVGFNFHGFPDRFNVNWSNVQAVVVSQAMRCIPNAGTDLTDCTQLGYTADVGLDSWATTSSNFDNFATHGGVSGGRFKPVTTAWQLFTNWAGPKSLPMPPAPVF